jgi:hypothetical protein
MAANVLKSALRFVQQRAGSVMKKRRYRGTGIRGDEGV